MDAETVKLGASLAQLLLGFAVFPAIKAVMTLKDAVNELKVTIHRDFATKHDLEELRNEIPKRANNT